MYEEVLNVALIMAVRLVAHRTEKEPAGESGSCLRDVLQENSGFTMTV